MWFKAAWIIPITQPVLKDAWIQIDDQHILALQTHPPQDMFTDLGNAILMPGLINAHVHLEWSHLRNQIQPQKTFMDWLMTIKSLSNQALDGKNLRAAMDEIYQCGTVLIAEITNTKKTVSALAEARFESIIFEEIVGWNISNMLHPDPHIYFTPHSLHGLSREDLKKIILQKKDDVPISIHFAESKEEIEFLEKNSGNFKKFFKQKYSDKIIPSPKKNIVSYAEDLGLLHHPLLLVHAVHLKPQDFDKLAHWPISICTCPRSNFFTGVGKFDLEYCLKQKINVCVGTDGISSNFDLNLWNELTWIKSNYPSISSKTILELATINGAKALQYESKLGSIDIGKKSDILVFSPNETIHDCENWLIEHAAYQKPQRLKNLMISPIPL